MSTRVRSAAVQRDIASISRLVTGLVVAAVVVAVVAVPAGAKVSGANGRIAFARNDPASTEGDTFAFTANPDGTHQVQLYAGHHAGAPHWSPNGSEVAVSSDAGLPCCTVASVIVNPDTGNALRVLPMQQPDTIFTNCVIWSPDAARLACEGQGQSDPSLNGIYTIRSSDGGDLKRITSIAGGDDIPIDYSPDGSQIVFGRSDPSRSPGCPNFFACVNQALFVVNLDGSGLRRITPWGYWDDDGSWSPDGTKIAFVKNDGSLFVVHPDGTGLMKIPLATSGRAFAGDVSWSPDGTKIVFILSTPTGAPAGGPKASFQEGIATANADGSNVQMVTNSPTFDHQPDWGSHPLMP